MSSKAEYKRTMKKLKEKAGDVPAVVKMKKKKRGWGNLPNESLADQRASKISENEQDMVPAGHGTREVVEFKVTNGLELPNWVVLIKEVTDLKVAKKVARLASSWYRKLTTLEEIRLVRTFEVGQDVWWTKKGQVVTGVVSRLKTKKLVVKTGQGLVDTVVLPVKKVRKGPVPTEYLHPDTSRWAIGRKAG